MFNFKFLIPISGLAAVSTVSGVMFWKSNSKTVNNESKNENSVVEEEKLNDYLIVSSLKTFHNIKEEITKFDPNVAENFKCKLSTNLSLSAKCSLIEIDKEDVLGGGAGINNKKINNINKPAQNIQKNKHYKITTTDKSFLSQSFDENSVINIEFNSSSNENKTIAELKFVAKCYEGNLTGKTKWLLAKKSITSSNSTIATLPNTNVILARVSAVYPTKNPTISSGKTTKCLGETHQAYVDCEVVTLPDNWQPTSPITETSLEKISNTNKTKWEKKKYVLIKFNDNKTEQELKSYGAIVVSQSDASSSASEFLLTSRYVNSYSGVLNTASGQTTSLTKIEDSKFRCKFLEDQTAKDCLIYDKFKPTADSNNKDWDVSLFEQSINLPTKNDYLIIESPDYQSISDLKNKKIEISVSNSEEKINFDIIAPLHVNIDKFKKIIDVPIILS